MGARRSLKVSRVLITRMDVRRREKNPRERMQRMCVHGFPFALYPFPSIKTLENLRSICLISMKSFHAVFQKRFSSFGGR